MIPETWLSIGGYAFTKASALLIVQIKSGENLELPMGIGLLRVRPKKVINNKSEKIAIN